MEAENTLSLFDCYWFELEILKKQKKGSNSEPRADQKTQQISIPSLPIISTMSMDDLVSSSSSISSLSPSSVLLSRKLQTIFSGKETKDTSSSEEEGEGKIGKPARTGEGGVEMETPKSLSGGDRRRTSRKEQRNKKAKARRGPSKSLSDLEFEELKGFMDLGFVFSEEDKESEFLATILPGLRRLGVEGEHEKSGKTRRSSVNGSGMSRPYLSEAWQVSERNRMSKKQNHPLMMSWGDLPSVGSKIDMKDYLKCWAHTVASSVR